MAPLLQFKSQTEEFRAVRSYELGFFFVVTTIPGLTATLDPKAPGVTALQMSRTEPSLEEQYMAEPELRERYRDTAIYARGLTRLGIRARTL